MLLLINLPEQLNPFSSKRYPTVQLQEKLPTALVQICSQPPLVVLHSLMSGRRGNENHYCMTINSPKTTIVSAGYLPMHLTPATCRCSQVVSPRGVKRLHSNREASNPEQSSWSKKMEPLPRPYSLNVTAPALSEVHFKLLKPVDPGTYHPSEILPVVDTLPQLPCFQTECHR